MNGFAVLFFLLIIAALGLFILIQRRDPGSADAIAGRADSLWKRLLGKLRRQ